MRTFVGSALMLALILLLAAFPSQALAQTDQCEDKVELFGFTVCFLGYEDNNDNTSTWTYMITSDNSSSTAALSHWTLELCPPLLGDVLNPTGTFVTASPVLSPNGTVTGRAGISYTVLTGQDPTTGITGIKFEDASDNLGEDGAVESDVFQIKIDGQWQPQDVAVGIKAAGDATATITGPSCSPSAVTLLSMKASDAASNPISFAAGAPFTWILLVVVLSASSLMLVVRRYRKELPPA